VYFDINDLNTFVLNDKNRHKSISEIDSEASTRVLIKSKRIL